MQTNQLSFIARVLVHHSFPVFFRYFYSPQLIAFLTVHHTTTCKVSKKRSECCLCCYGIKPGWHNTKPFAVFRMEGGRKKNKLSQLGQAKHQRHARCTPCTERKVSDPTKCATADQHFTPHRTTAGKLFTAMCVNKIE